MSFLDKLKSKWQEGKFVCVGLDPDYSKLPPQFKNNDASKDLLLFNQKVIDQTADLVCSYKLQSAYYEVFGEVGWRILKQTVEFIQQKYSDIPLILDAKRGDIGNTNQAYAQAIFDKLGVDAVTVNPYPGRQSLQPFLDYKDKGIIVWVGASGAGSDEFQELLVGEDQQPLYQVIAKHIIQSWNANRNCAVVVGATFPDKLRKIREIVGDIPILIPGVGAQGGDLEATVKAGKDSSGQGMIISSSRGIIFAENPREASLKLHQDILRFLKL